MRRILGRLGGASVLPRRAPSNLVAPRLLPPAARSVHTCILCDEDVDDFSAHLETDAHVARFTVCQTLAAPQKHAGMLKQMWEHLRLDFDAVAEVNAEKAARRRLRLSSTITYLVQRSVLFDSVPRTGADNAELLHVPPRFCTLELLGEFELRNVVTDRCARLFPDANGHQLRALVEIVTQRWQLEVLFDLLDLRKALSDGLEASRDSGVTQSGQDAALPRFSGAQRARVVLAVIGELQMRCGDRRPTEVDGKVAADGLVDNVLASHVLDNIESELIHHVLQKVVDDGTPVWGAFKESLVASSLSSERPKPAVLSSAPTEAPSAPTPADVVETSFAAADDGQTDLAPACSPRPVWRDATRAHALELTVPKPTSKGAFFAAIIPKLSSKAKGGKAASS